MAIRPLLVCVLVFAGLVGAGPCQLDGAEPGETPHWIHVETAQTVQIGRVITIRDAIQAARLRLAADFCQVEVTINGRVAAVIEPYCQTLEIEITPLMKLGENQIVVGASRAHGPAAVALELSLETSAGRQTVMTDENWTMEATSPVRTVGSVAPQLWGAGRRSIDLDATENYEQWRQASGESASDLATFWAAPGFEVALLRTAQADEGSWVSMAFDPVGRLTIAREDQGLLRLTLDGEKRAVTAVEAIDRTLQECRGLLYAHGALYANANNSKGLYRLTDENGDGQFDKTDLLREFPGGVGHGRNDLGLGPDGMIYSIHGDSVDVPTANVLDRTSPFREARRGKKTSEGYLLRTDRNGKHWELLCGGLRNPFGVAINEHGDIFTYDADAEFDMGTPWYRPTRVVQLVSGGDYAWRGVTGRWPPYFPDHSARTPATLDIGKGSPTAVAFGTKSDFPQPYRDALFILDWTYGRVLAVHLAPRGAGYRAAAETFVQGRPLNVTDLAFGPDGAMYLITGGRKTQSALYKISYAGSTLAPSTASEHELDCATHAKVQRQLRRELEALHGRVDPRAIDRAWPQLDSDDPLIRYAARLAIEHQPLSEWRERGLADERPAAALTALTSLLASGENSAAAVAFDCLLRLEPAELDLSQSLTWLHLLEAAGQASPESLAKSKARVVARLVEFAMRLKEVAPSVGQLGSGLQFRRELSRLLVEFEAPGAIDRADQLLVSESQDDRMMGLLILRNAKDGWTADLRRRYFTALNDGSRFLGGEGLPRFLSSLRDDATANLSDADRRQLGDVLAASSAGDADLTLPARSFVKKWTVEELLPALNDPKPRGDAVRGASVFREALCVHCHRIGARGPAVGPDLNHVAGRFSRRDLLVSILTPAAVVAENYRNVHLTLGDGRSLVGRVIVEGDYRSETLRLMTDPLRPSKTVEINKRDIERSKPADTSPMPTGLLDTFDEQEILDLLAFLEGGVKVEKAK